MGSYGRSGDTAVDLVGQFCHHETEEDNVETQDLPAEYNEQECTA